MNLSGSCGANCNQVLPNDLIDFYAIQNENKNDLVWKVASEEGVKSYVIEKSEDGIQLIELTRIYNNANNGKYQNISYETEDLYPYISYYRLSTIENDGSVKRYKTIDLDRNKKEWKSIVFQKENELWVEFKNYLPKQSAIFNYMT